ncbi:MAG: signal peptidase I [Burkholderiaceae bacterium]
MSAQPQQPHEVSSPGQQAPSGLPPKQRQKNHRRPVLAAVMSACLPGMGQLYNGQANRAIWLLVGFCLIATPLGAFLALTMPGALMAPTMALWLLATIGLWLWNIWDAWRGARLAAAPVRSWQISGLYAAIFLIFAGLILPTVLGKVRADLVHPVHIVGNSMAPTLLAGDRLFIDMRVNCQGCTHALERGDIVLFTYPNDRSQWHIKRLIGLPGDRVTVSDDSVTVDDAELIEDSIADQAQTITVPTGHAYLLGDNLSNSLDSTDYGVIPLRDIVGKARQIYFSTDQDAVRWHRIGHQVK